MFSSDLSENNSFVLVIALPIIVVAIASVYAYSKMTNCPKTIPPLGPLDEPVKTYRSQSSDIKTSGESSMDVTFTNITIGETVHLHSDSSYAISKCLK